MICCPDNIKHPFWKLTTGSRLILTKNNDDNHSMCVQVHSISKPYIYMIKTILYDGTVYSVKYCRVKETIHIIKHDWMKYFRSVTNVEIKESVNMVEYMKISGKKSKMENATTDSCLSESPSPISPKPIISPKSPISPKPIKSPISPKPIKSPISPKSLRSWIRNKSNNRNRKTSEEVGKPSLQFNLSKSSSPREWFHNKISNRHRRKSAESDTKMDHHKSDRRRTKSVDLDDTTHSIDFDKSPHTSLLLINASLKLSLTMFENI